MNKLFSKDMLIRIVLVLVAVNLIVLLFRPVIVQHRKDMRKNASRGEVTKCCSKNYPIYSKEYLLFSHEIGLFV